jgi:hypothetical protein
MFKVKNNAVQLGQESVKVVCRTGTQFVEDNIIRFEIPKGLGFLDLANSYLEAEVEIGVPGQAQNSTQPCLQFDPIAGANNLIERMTIRSSGGRVIEELAGYSVYANLHHNATLSEGNMNKRTILEGCAKSLLIQDNPWATQNAAPVPVAAINAAAATGLNSADQCWKPVRRKVCLPLLGGVFGVKESFPVFELGLEVELILNKALRVLRVSALHEGNTLDSVVCDDSPQAQGNVPYVVISERALFNSMGGATAVGIGRPDAPGGAVPAPSMGEQNITGACNLPLRVGQVVRLSATGADANAGNYTIAKIDQLDSTAAAGTENKLVVYFTGDWTANPRTGIITNVRLHQLAADGSPLAEHGSIGYSVNEPRLVLQKVIPPASVAQSVANGVRRGQYNINLNSWVMVNTSIPANQTTSTNQIAVDLSRVKSILSVPTNQSNTDNLLYANGLQGLYLDASRYIYQIDNKFRPDRHVDLNREQFPAALRAPGQDEVRRPYKLGQHPSGFHLFENEKALLAAGIDLKNLNFITPNSGTDNQYQAVLPGSWLVGRSLAGQAGTSMNIMGKSVLLYLDYRATSNMVKLLHHFVVHNRSIVFEGMNGIAIDY